MSGRPGAATPPAAPPTGVPAGPSFAESRAYPARPFLAASVAVFRDGRVLLAERAAPPGDRRFSLPGGLVEPGETIREAALRELREETGVVAEIVGFNDHVEVIERDADGRVAAHFVVTSFVGRWVSGEAATGPEALRTLWVEPDAVDHLATTAQLPAILRRAAAIVAASTARGAEHGPAQKPAQVPAQDKGRSKR